MTEAPVRELAPRHLEMLRAESAIADEVIVERGYYTLDDFTACRALGFKESQCILPAMVIPVHTVTGEHGGYVLRPDSPRLLDEKIVKYEWPSKKPLVIDVPPRCQKDMNVPDVPLWITEGSKKADSLASAGLCAISLNGVAGWRGTNPTGGKAALGDWESIALNSREVVLAFDSDSSRKVEVAYMLGRLQLFLTTRKALVKVLYLPDLEDGNKQGVDDFLARGHTAADFVPYISLKVEYVAPKRAPDNKPYIVVNGRPHEQIVNECWVAVAEEEEKNRRIFIRNQELVRIAVSDSGALSIKAIQLDEWIGYIERAAHAVNLIHGSLAPSGFSQKVARDMLVNWTKPQTIPRLAGIAEAPFFGRDGQLVSQHGYDAATGMFLNLPPNLRGLSVPEAPSHDEVKAAIEVWDDVVADFPFVDRADRANALAFALTPFVRGLLDDVSPLNFVTATTRGSGKGLLVNVLTIPATGRDIRCVTMPWRNDEEVDKRLIGLLHDGIQQVHFDNVEGKLDSPVLASFTTALEYGGRILGSTNSGSWPQRVVAHISGNNVMLGGDIPRRVVPIRLAPNTERPDLRPAETFRHPNLIRWLKSHRREVVLSLLTLVQNWIHQGMKICTTTMGSFEKWAQSIGGILEAAGYEGFLENRDDLLEATDMDTSGWHSLVEVWWERYQTRPVSIADLDAATKDIDDSPIAARHKDDTDKQRQMRLALALHKQRGRVFRTYRIKQAGKNPRTKKISWALEYVGSEITPMRANQTLPENRIYGGEIAEGAEGLYPGAEIGRNFEVPFPDRAADLPHLPHLPQFTKCDCLVRHPNEADCGAEEWITDEVNAAHCLLHCEIYREVKE